ncbi:MAG: DUF1707 SHOCT-like domain-containing protein [Streptomycetales bacterium]
MTHIPGSDSGDAHPPQMRASDADRDRVADLLGEALAEGRLTSQEHGERIDRAYAARTLGELEPLTRDLPATARGARPSDPGLPAARPGLSATSHNAVAVFGGAERRGRWVVPRRFFALAAFGGVTLDLRNAVLTSEETVIRANAVCGGVEIVVPQGLRVDVGGVAIFGGNSGPRDPDGTPGAPVVRVIGLSLCGGVDVRRARPTKPGETQR